MTEEAAAPAEDAVDTGTPVADSTPAPAETPADSTPTPAEANPADDKTPPQEVDGAPEQYGDFNIPEGVTVQEQLLSDFKTAAKEMNLSQENAQKLVDMQTGLMREQEEARTKAWDDLQDGWVESSKNDQEFGGEKFEENMGVAKQALEAFGTDGLKEALETSGMGNHPEFLRFFYRVGQQVSEGKIHVGGHNPRAESFESFAKSFYNNSDHN